MNPNLTPNGRNKDLIRSKVEHLTNYESRYGQKPFNSADGSVLWFKLLRHCVNLTPVQSARPEKFVQKRFRASTYAMETAFELGSMMLLENGTQNTPTPSEITKSFGYYRTFLKEEN